MPEYFNPNPHTVHLTGPDGKAIKVRAKQRVILSEYFDRYRARGFIKLLNESTPIPTQQSPQKPKRVLPNVKRPINLPTRKTSQPARFLLRMETCFDSHDWLSYGRYSCFPFSHSRHSSQPNHNSQLLSQKHRNPTVAHPKPPPSRLARSYSSTLGFRVRVVSPALHAISPTKGSAMASV